MNTIAGKPLALALLLAAGLLVALFAAGVFSPRGAQAQTGHEIELENLNAGDPVEVTASFTIASGELSVGDQVVIKLKGFGVPSTIAPSAVLVKDMTYSNQPADVSVSGTTITVEIGDMTRADTQVQPAAGGIEIVFRQRAGITNPTRSGDYTPSITIDAVETETTVRTIIKTLKVSPNNGSRGSEITVSGVGYSDGTVSIYRVGGDSPAAPETNNANPSGASRLVTSSVNDGSFSASFTIDASQFDLSDGWSGVPDRIQAKDGDGYWGPAKAFHLLPTLILEQNEVKRGSDLTIKLQDWGYGPVGSVTVGSTGANVVGAFPAEVSQIANCADADTPACLSHRQLNVNLNSPEGFKVTVATGTETGTQTVVVAAASNRDNPDDENIGGSLRVVGSVDVLPAYTTSLSVTPSTAVVGQSITVEGEGFTETDLASTTTVTENRIETITIGGANVPLSGIDRGVAAGGRVVASFSVPDDAALAAADGYTIELKDGAGRSAKATLTIPQEAVTVTPSESRIGTTIEVDCTGFPTGSGKTISIFYEGRVERTTRADGSGNCDAVSFEVPNTAGVGKSHTVSARADVGTGEENVVANTTHKTPKATVSLSVTEANRGSDIWITGANFNTFQAIEVEIGGTEVTPAPTPTTDRDGSFRIEVKVPGISLGDRNVKVEVNNVPVVEILRITDAPVVRTPANAFSDLGDNLEVVWYLDNATKRWYFYDPDFAESDMTSAHIASGNVYAVQVSADADFEGRSLTTGWNNIALR